MTIEVEDSVFSVKKWECTVKSNDNVATFIKMLIDNGVEPKNIMLDDFGG
jgi:Na+-transporting NADH:ubiquinone oxidoreductase subunit NqrF